MKKIYTIIAVLVLGAGTAWRNADADPKLQKKMDNGMTIKKFMEQADKDFWKYSRSVMYQNQGFEDGHGMFAWPPALKTFPKRIGLLSYVVFDPGFSESVTKKYGYLSITTSSYGALSAKNTKDLANGLYKMSIDEMKKSFQAYNAELLTPDEFLKTDDQRNVYQSFSYKEKGAAKLFSGQGGANTLANPDNFHEHYADNLTNPDFVAAIGKQTEALGLDAGMIMKVQMGVDGDGTVMIQSVSFAVYGKNPVEKIPGKKYVAINPATGYNPYVVYEACKMGAFDTDHLLETKEGLNIVVSVSNKNSVLTDFNEYDHLIGRITGGVSYSLNSWIKGEKKPFKY